MTNKMIILMESIKLMEEGILQPTGQKIVVDTDDGKKELDIPEPIHTYQTWKKLGYQVQKGEKAIAQFPIWKFINGKLKEEEVRDDVDVDKNQNEKGYCRLKTANFFKASQVKEVAK